MPASPAPRLPFLDKARGIALAAMVVYHFVWDLSFLGLIDPAIRDSLLWSSFARVIAASFLVLAGIGLVLAHGQGLDRAKFLRRLALVAGAALLVTAGTWLVFPDAFVFFGILHAIALGSVLALPFLGRPVWLTLLAAGAVWLLPFLIQNPAMAAPALIWIGLGDRLPNSTDFVPVFPWFGFMLLGVAVGRLVDWSRLSGPEPATRPGRLLVTAGRRSLLVYLVHQPLLLGMLWLVALIVVQRPDPEARPFLAACHAQCGANGGDAPTCTRLCRCALEATREEGLWTSLMRDQLNENQRIRVEAISKRCAEKASLR
ncbi:MAG: heparan-alpha-glucosaminide N-acetyltransferase [Beijerinckiaceae bacterium]|nr:heparan-alpha-glucosaminide N-acetyltransferase [Beijerinckiaceae bacterium]